MAKDKAITFKVGDEIWWFQARERIGMYNHSRISPDTLELVHDVITDIVDDALVCWHGTHRAEDIWGTSRKDAWARLKNKIGKWGELE